MYLVRLKSKVRLGFFVLRLLLGIKYKYIRSTYNTIIITPIRTIHNGHENIIIG